MLQQHTVDCYTCRSVYVKGTIIINCMHNFQLASVLYNYCAKNTDCLLLNHSVISHSFFTFAWQTACLENVCSKMGEESRLLWGGFVIWGRALFHTRRCCALCTSLRRWGYLCNHIIYGQLLKTSIMTGCLCFGALWNFCLPWTVTHEQLKVSYFYELV